MIEPSSSDSRLKTFLDPVLNSLVMSAGIKVTSARYWVSPKWKSAFISECASVSGRSRSMKSECSITLLPMVMSCWRRQRCCRSVRSAVESEGIRS